MSALANRWYHTILTKIHIKNQYEKDRFFRILRKQRVLRRSAQNALFTQMPTAPLQTL